MKWALVLAVFFMFFTADAQYLRATHPTTFKSIDYPIGSNVFFKKKASKAVQRGTILAFRNDSLVLNTDSFPVEHLLHISPERLLTDIGFSLLSATEVFGFFLQYGVGSALYIALTAETFVSGGYLDTAIKATILFYVSGRLIRFQGRFFKNVMYAFRPKSSFELVLN